MAAAAAAAAVDEDSKLFALGLNTFKKPKPECKLDKNVVSSALGKGVDDG